MLTNFKRSVTVIGFSFILVAALGGCSSGESGRTGASRATARTDVTDSTGSDGSSGTDTDTDGQPGSPGNPGTPSDPGNSGGHDDQDGDHGSDDGDDDGDTSGDRDELEEDLGEVAREYKCLARLAERLERELWRAKASAVKCRDDGDSFTYLARTYEIKEGSGDCSCEIESREQTLTGRRAIREHIESVQLALVDLKARLWQLRREARALKRELRKLSRAGA